MRGWNTSMRRVEHCLEGALLRVGMRRRPGEAAIAAFSSFSVAFRQSTESRQADFTLLDPSRAFAQASL